MGQLKPVEQALRLCQKRGGDFRTELEWFLLHGYVISRPDLFAMGCDCPKGVEIDLTRAWTREESDSVFVWVAIGGIHELVNLLPWQPKHIGWYRQGRNWRQSHWVLREGFTSALAFHQRFR